MVRIVTGGNSVTKVLRWIARTITILTISFALFMLVGSALFDDTPANLAIIVFVIQFFIVGTGLVLAWRWERLGGWIAIIGSLSMAPGIYLESGHNELAAAILLPSPFLIAGSLHLICWLRTGRAAKR